jgi:HPr kinase/phosphorylase
MRLFNPKEVVDRLGSTSKTIEYLGVKVPYVKLPVSSGRSMAELVEIAITNFKLKDSGFDSAREFERRMDVEREKARIALEAKNKI